MSDIRAIKRVLIANRGEIARRIIRTCSRLGIETVAVFTDVDAHAPHVSEATYAQAIGGPESYLSPEAIIKAAHRSGADSVHPGYGFLSENADFAAAVSDAGLLWIGPSSETIRSLGSKTAAKELAHAANVPVAPTLLLPKTDPVEVARDIETFGNRVGFPLILKAAAGGGGRGMRFIHDATGIARELESARREALKAFKSAEVFVEKCITNARHIEVQIAADIHGTVVALGTRDCSLQRNNQKIIEEAPACNLAQGTEEKLYSAACALARAAGYVNLGTVEFLYTYDGSFYFLEVNTRLQVEHPVTEMVTGLDLVELQLRVAAGTSLASCGVHGSPTPSGHAIEARWCAEEYTDTFVTATGVVLDIHTSSATPPGVTVRCDRGVEACSEVSHYYDSLIGKVIVHAHSRTAAIEALDVVLSNSRLSGVRNNRALLLHLIRTNEFKGGTHTVGGTKDLLPTPTDIYSHRLTAHLVAAAIRCATARSAWMANGPWLSTSGPDAQLTYPWTTRIDCSSTTSLTRHRDGSFEVKIVDSPATLISVVEGPYVDASLTTASISINSEEPVNVSLYQDGTDLWVHLPVGTYLLHEPAIGEASSSAFGSLANEVRSTIPGKVAAVIASEGDVVELGAVLLVLDSMKMEHPIRAPLRGRVVALPIPLGSIVPSGTLLAVIEPS